MKVAIAQVDGKWPNLALAKLAAWHRAQGDDVSRFNPLLGADLVLASKVFTDTNDDLYLPADAVRGGSGYDLTTRLPDEVEAMRPDWSLWPSWRHDVGYSTRGCVRRCAFCNVREKDGDLRVVAEFGDLWSGRDRLILLDANITASPIDHFWSLCHDATAAGVRLDFSQGLDARLITEAHARIIARSKLTHLIHFAFDSMGDEAAVRRAVKVMRAGGVRAYRLMFFVLVGFDTTPEEDMYRIDLLRSLKVNPFVMPFDRRDRYQRDLARWCNAVPARQSCTFAEYCHAPRSTPKSDLQPIGAILKGES